MRAIHTCFRDTKQVNYLSMIFSKSPYIRGFIIPNSKPLKRFFLAIHVYLLLDFILDYLGIWNRNERDFWKHESSEITAGSH